MKPKQINKAVAKALGYKVKFAGKPKRWLIHQPGATGHQCTTGSATEAEEWENGPPSFVYDISAAISICDFVVKEGVRVAINKFPSEMWECTFATSDYRFFTGLDDVLPGAICEAFLRLEGIWRE